MLGILSLLWFTFTCVVAYVFCVIIGVIVKRIF